MEDLGDFKKNYGDYLFTALIDCDKEMERLPDADYELSTALFTMLLRENHFCNGSFEERLEAGQVDAVLKRMIETLKRGEPAMYDQKKTYLRTIIRRIFRMMGSALLRGICEMFIG